MRKRTPFLIFWPAYFDKNRTVSEGRRLAKKLAIEKITLEDIVRAVKTLGYDYKVEMNPKYPKTWWEVPGRVLIDGKGKKKNKLLLELSKQIRKYKGN